MLAAARARSNARNDWLITDLDLLHALLGGDQAVQALLAGAGVDMVALRRRVDAHSDARAEDADAAANAHLTYSDAVAEALERATHLAIVGGHIRVDTVHLLAALAQSRRSAAQLLLRDAGASLWAIERATHRTAEASSDNPAGATLPPRRVRPGSDTVGGGARTIVTKVGRILRRYLQLANGA